MAKKTFKEIGLDLQPITTPEGINPALQFISSATPEEIKPETKSIRLNLLIKPTTKEDLSKIAYLKRTSINNLINEALEEYLANNKEALELYNTKFTN